MKLGTIGAVLRFAINLERLLQELAESIYSKSTDVKIMDQIKKVSEIHKKRAVHLKRLQRENTTEMILEPIVNFSSDEYEIKLQIVEEAGTPIVKGLQEAEITAQSFYKDAATKVSFLPEIEDTFLEFQEEFTKSIRSYLQN